jgi:hypothetical protein
MNSLKRRTRINVLLARFVAQVETSNKLGRMDVNREAQNLCVSLFKIIYSFSGLRNLDITERQNYPGIDLADDAARVAFQITSDAAAKKVRETLTNFGEYHLHQKYDRLIFYILTRKRAQSKVNFSTDVPTGFKFDKNTDVIDSADLQRDIEGLDSDKQRRVLELLEDEFGDDTQQEAAWTLERFAPHAMTFVAPAKFEHALNILQRRGIVILVGPPHVGKTETAYELLLRANEVKKFGSIRYIQQIHDWSSLKSMRSKAILLDDLFGASEFDNHRPADHFEDLLRLGQDNLIVITTRASVLDEAKVGRRIGERGDLEAMVVELRQEGAYDDLALQQILENHICYSLSLPEGLRLTASQANILRRASAYVVHGLRFPHNIERLVNFHAHELEAFSNLDSVLDKAKDIKRAVRQWYMKQNRDVRLLAASLALFPHNTETDMTNFTQVVCKDIGIQAIDPRRLARQSSGYVEYATRPDLAHPAYVEGVIEALQEDDLDFAWDILRSRARSVQFDHIAALIQCRKAARILGKGNWQWAAPAQPRPITPEKHFSDYVIAYEHIITHNFPSMQAFFEPKWKGNVCIRIETTATGKPRSWALLRRLEGDPLVSITVEEHNAPDKLSRIDIEARDRTGHMYPVTHGSQDYTRSIPQIDALDYVLEQLTRALDKSDWSDEPVLVESWHLRMARLLLGLTSAGFPMDSISLEKPLTVEQLKEWADPLLEFATSGTIPFPFPQIRLMIAPDEQCINDLCMSLAIEDITILTLEGYPVTGQFLVLPDIPREEVVWRSPGISLSDYYSDAQLCDAVKLGCRTIFEAYKDTVERSFTSVDRQMDLFSNLPVEVTCILDRRDTEVTGWEHTNMWTQVSRLRNPVQGEVVRVNVMVISEKTDPAEQVLALSIRKGMLSDQYQDDILWWGGFSMREFLSLKEWRLGVVGLIAKDLKTLVGDR